MLQSRPVLHSHVPDAGPWAFGPQLVTHSTHGPTLPGIGQMRAQVDRIRAALDQMRKIGPGSTLSGPILARNRTNSAQIRPSSARFRPDLARYQRNSAQCGRESTDLGPSSTESARHRPRSTKLGPVGNGQNSGKIDPVSTSCGPALSSIDNLARMGQAMARIRSNLGNEGGGRQLSWIVCPATPCRQHKLFSHGVFSIAPTPPGDVFAASRCAVRVRRPATPTAFSRRPPKWAPSTIARCSPFLAARQSEARASLTQKCGRRWLALVRFAVGQPLRRQPARSRARLPPTD